MTSQNISLTSLMNRDKNLFHPMLGFLSQSSILSFRIVCKKTKEITDHVLNNCWHRLNTNRTLVQGLIDFPSLMGKVNAEYSKTNPMPAFQKLSREFAARGAALSAERLPLLIRDFQELQNQVELADKALVAIWSRMAATLHISRDHKSAEEIRSWFADPQNVAKFDDVSKINLSHLGLQVIPPELGKLKHLQSLDLSNNQLFFLSPVIGKLTNLSVLDLGNNQLTSLHSVVGDLKKLKHLYLNKNKLRNLPETIGNLTALKTIILNENRLRSLPASIGKLENLKEIDLSNNKLEFLPTSFWNLRKLTFISLFDNRFSSLPDQIGGLRDLQELILADNKLKFLPNTLEKLIHLKELNIKNNEWVCISEKIFKAPIACIQANKTLDDYKRQLTYEFSSPLAKLFQAIMQSKNEAEIYQLFWALPDSDKDLIFERVRIATGREKSDDYHWERHHFSDNPNHFKIYVREAIATKFAQLPQEGKNQIYLYYERFCFLADAMDLLEKT